MLPISLIGSIQHSTVMLKQGYIPNHGAVLTHLRLIQQMVGKRLFACPPILTDPRGQMIELFALSTGLPANVETTVKVKPCQWSRLLVADDYQK